LKIVKGEWGAQKKKKRLLCSGTAVIKGIKTKQHMDKEREKKN